MKKLAKAVLARIGLEIVRTAERDAQAVADLGAADRAIVMRVAPFTMTSPERRASLIGAVDHVVRHRVAGDIVECGVWRGGSMMTIALALMARGDTSRHLWLYDTFEGMSEPTEHDRDPTGVLAAERLKTSLKDSALWAVACLDDVRANLLSTGYPPDRLHFVRGKVEDTIPGDGPHRIALLRLDTDWYESTRHELQHFYPRLSAQGVLIIDDYGHWQGARRAVDEYFGQRSEPVFLHRVDYTARLIVKA